jgi:transcriptional regulator with GAF, ATPase, and Fis domain
LEDAFQEVTEREASAFALAPKRISVSVVKGPDTGQVWDLGSKGPFTVGSAPDSTIVLHDPRVSRYHLELDRTPEGISICDLGSLNGSFCGAIRIERAVIPPASKITLGKTILLVDETRAEAVSPTVGDRIVIPGIIGDSDAMRSVCAQIQCVVSKPTTVLLRGETGTGKELFARAIHDLSPRKNKPFVIVDCGAIPPTLIASELFGHERGAFTGADDRRQGAFERANGGTLFLDEIGELPLSVQPVLLGVIERRRFKRVGGTDDEATDVRIICATHRDLRSEVNAVNFRADLYFRLAVTCIVIPPLRERRGDISALVSHFVREVTGSDGPSPFDAATMQMLVTNHWSGNVRELRNVVESILTMGPANLPASTSVPDLQCLDGIFDQGPLPPYREARAELLAKFEHTYLSRLILEHKGNASAAARHAQLDRPYLVSLLRRHSLR